jgi:hypothetical protein
MLRIYQYQTDCFKQADDFDQPQRGSWVVQRLVNGWWRNYLWSCPTRDAAEKVLHEFQA